MWSPVVWGCMVILAVVTGENITKSLTETDDAYILDADLPDKTDKAVTPTTSTRLFTGNTAIDGAVVGLGVGVIGSLLIGKLLEEKNKCNPRGRRDTASTRFLPDIFGGKKCPPPPHNSGYQPNSGYQQQNSGYRPTSGYQQPNSGYQQPNSGYKQPNSGYQQPNSGYQQPNSGYRPNSGYQQPNLGYQQPNSGYQQSNSGYQQPNSGYQQPNRNQPNTFSQTNPHRATPAPFSSGLHSVHHQSSPVSHQSPQRHPAPAQTYPGIVGRSLPKADKSKINFGR